MGTGVLSSAPSSSSAVDPSNRICGVRDACQRVSQRWEVILLFFGRLVAFTPSPQGMSAISAIHPSPVPRRTVHYDSIVVGSRSRRDGIGLFLLRISTRYALMLLRSWRI